MRTKDNTNAFLVFEQASLRAVIRNDLPPTSEADIQKLLRQVEVAGVKERSIFDKAFFTIYYYQTEVQHARSIPDGIYGAMQALVPGLDISIGFGLTIDDGLIISFEGYTYGEPWPRNLSRFELVHLIPTEDGGNRLPKASWE